MTLLSDVAAAVADLIDKRANSIAETDDSADINDSRVDEDDDSADSADIEDSIDDSAGGHGIGLPRRDMRMSPISPRNLMGVLTARWKPLKFVCVDIVEDVEGAAAQPGKPS
jgi:hypothetical protein